MIPACSLRLATAARAAILLTTVEQKGKLYIDAGGAATVRYDLLLVVRGDHLYAETIRLAQERGTKTATWSSDDIFNPLNSFIRQL